MKRTVERFHNRVFYDLNMLTKRVRERVFDEFVEDADRCRITFRELGTLAEGADGKTFLARFRGLALERGVTILGN